jgi:hypothetical protein
LPRFSALYMFLSASFNTDTRTMAASESRLWWPPARVALPGAQCLRGPLKARAAEGERDQGKVPTPGPTIRTAATPRRTIKHPASSRNTFVLKPLRSAEPLPPGPARVV